MKQSEILEIERKDERVEGRETNRADERRGKQEIQPARTSEKEKLKWNKEDEGINEMKRKNAETKEQKGKEKKKLKETESRKEQRERGIAFGTKIVGFLCFGTIYGICSIE